MENLISLEERLDGASEASPELHLTGDGALNGVAGYAGIEDERVGEFDGLWHQL
jgi:hypothetical protein